MVNFVIHDGESNWLQGLMLLVVYFLVAIAFIEHNAETGRGHPVFCCAQPPSETKCWPWKCAHACSSAFAQGRLSDPALTSSHSRSGCLRLEACGRRAVGVSQ